MTKEALESVQACETLPGMSDRFLVVLLNDMSGNDPLPLRRAFISLQNRAKELYGQSLTVVIGPEGGVELSGLYQRTVELRSYVIKYGYGAIIDEAVVARDIAGKDLFPAADERQLVIGLSSLSGEHCIASIQAIVRQLYGYSMNDILRTINHILYSTLQTIKEMIQNKELSIEFDTFNAYEKLMSYETLQEFEANLIAFYEQIIAEFNKGDEGRHHTIRKVLEHIHQHYGDSAISLDGVASSVNLNPSYLGKLFKESEGVHFTEYVNQLRMNRAQQLLKETSDPLTKISSQVGFNSTSYFVTCFKKYTVMTPTKFRSGS
jgi:AraC-like DNA-binding protein